MLRALSFSSHMLNNGSWWCGCRGQACEKDSDGMYTYIRVYVNIHIYIYKKWVFLRTSSSKVLIVCHFGILVLLLNAWYFVSIQLTNMYLVAWGGVKGLSDTFKFKRSLIGARGFVLF